jgi:carbon-monoxide dehydrogenase small subunit/xanthine dehydrogenase small subunit
VSEPVEIAFTVNGEWVRRRVEPEQRLLDLLRDDLRLTGAKEGCGKGECGACSVLVDGELVDACLVMAFQVDGTALETIEALARGDRLDPVQEGFIAEGGVQCGICIPGMVMAARALLDRIPRPSYEEIRLGLAGNLCRCTGYTKIFAAVEAASHEVSPIRKREPAAPVAPHALRPRSLEEALEVLEQGRGEVRPLAGGTDLLVQAMDRGARGRAGLFDLTAIPELRGIEDRGDEIWIGAATTHTEMMSSELLAEFLPSLPQACSVIGGPQIRNRGTLGGNLANGSPAADAVPPLYAADAVVELVSVTDRRDIPVDRFYSGYRRSALADDELILGVRFPKRLGVRGSFLRLGQREAQAISKVSLALGVRLTEDGVDWVRISLGAVAPTVIRAPRAEQVLLEAGSAGLERAQQAIRESAQPIDDLRSTAEYRREMAALLLGRAWRQATDGS